MTNPTASLASALDRDTAAFVVVYYAEDEARERIMAEVDSLVSPSTPRLVTDDIDAALTHPDTLVFLLPNDEQDAVLTLDGMREHFTQPPRRQPVVLFLLRDGSGPRALPHAAGFASWIRGQELDPDREAEIEPEVERAAFMKRTGKLPEAWLADWRAAGEPLNAETIALSFRAKFLEGA